MGKSRAGLSSQRSYAFSGVSYLPRDELQTCINAHAHQIKHYAYIIHDCDTDENGEIKQTHIHIILLLSNASTSSAVCRWFGGYLDEHGQSINTLMQVTHDIPANYDYLSHKNNPEKFQYDIDNIITDDILTWTEEISIDSAYLALSDMCAGVPLDTICRRYGRDFIIHYSSFKLVYNDIMENERR